MFFLITYAKVWDAHTTCVVMKALSLSFSLFKMSWELVCSWTNAKTMLDKPAEQDVFLCCQGQGLGRTHNLRCNEGCHRFSLSSKWAENIFLAKLMMFHDVHVLLTYQAGWVFFLYYLRQGLGCTCMQLVSGWRYVYQSKCFACKMGWEWRGREGHKEERKINV